MEEFREASENCVEYKVLFRISASSITKMVLDYINYQKIDSLTDSVLTKEIVKGN